MADEVLLGAARDPAHLAALRSLSVRSAMVVPMRVRSRTVGVMSFGTSESERRLNHDDVALAEQLAARAAVAVENSRLHTTLSRVSETLQQSLLPRDPPESPAGRSPPSTGRPGRASGSRSAAISTRCSGPTPRRWR